MLSSEDDLILEMGKTYNCPVLKRPEWLATDKAMNEGVMIHTAYTYCEKLPDWLVLLQPTSPNRTAEDIDTCIERAVLDKGCVTYNEYGKLNGAVYVVNTQHFISLLCFDKTLFNQFYCMPNDRSLDVDYPADLVA